MKRPKISKQLAIALVALVVIAGGIIIALQLTHDAPKKETGSASTQNAAKAVQTLSSPEPVVKDIPKYQGKTIAVTGKVSQIDKDYYLVGGSDPKSQSAIKLDFNTNNVDPKPYAEVTPKTEQEIREYQPKESVVVTGKFVAREPRQPMTLVVTKVDPR